MVDKANPMPDDNATLEHHGIRGISGNNRNAQIAPLNQRYSERGAQLRYGDLEGDAWLRYELEFFILAEILAVNATAAHGAIVKMTTAYQRTFSEWLERAAHKYAPRYDHATVREQLAYAWNSIEALLSTDPPR